MFSIMNGDDDDDDQVQSSLSSPFTGKNMREKHCSDRSWDGRCIFSNAMYLKVTTIFFSSRDIGDYLSLFFVIFDY